MGTVIDIVLMFLAATGAISIVVCGVAAVFVFRHSGKIRRLSGRIKKALKGRTAQREATGILTGLFGLRLNLFYPCIVFWMAGQQ